MPLSLSHHIALSACLAAAALPTIPSVTRSQSITFDGTLGTIRNLTGPTYQIQQSDGITVGTNLFHSFGRFSLNAGERANFFSAPSIQNILARVTGGVRSDINGLIFTQSANVNLFLINPSGITFGANASLDIGGVNRGSFVATTLDAITFPNGTQFGATNPSNATSLLNIIGDPSGFLSTQRNLQPITVIGSTLAVYQGQSLILLGGGVSLSNALLSWYIPPAGTLINGLHIGIGGVDGAGTVGLDVNGNQLSLQVSDKQTRTDVSIADSSELYVKADNGGSISVYGKNLNILGGSQLLAGIQAASGSPSSKAGDINLNASEILTITGRSTFVSNDVNTDATGNGGNILISAGSLEIVGGSQLSASTFGQGNSGRVEIQARDTVSLFGRGRSEIESDVGFGGVGNSGGVVIRTGSLFLTDLAIIGSDVDGRGNSGGVKILARDLVSLDDPGEIKRGGQASTLILSRVNEDGIGNGGDIDITTGSLLLSNSQLTSSTSGQGNSGNVVINARNQVALRRSGDIFTEVTSPSETDNGIGGIGNGGDIRITTGSLLLDGGSNLRADTESRGNAGNIVINAQDIIWSGSSTEFTSGAFSQVEPNAIGRGGDIIINTGSLSLSGDQEISTRTQGQGDAGNINITANSIFFVGDDVFVNSEVSRDNRVAEGTWRGGDINIRTETLTVLDGAQISATTEAQGNAGNINIFAGDSVRFDGISVNRFPSGVFASVEFDGIGNGGSINIQSQSLLVTNGAKLRAETEGLGNAGNINIRVADAAIFNNQGEAFSNVDETGMGRGGMIRVDTGSLQLSNGSRLVADTRGQGDAGDIVMNARDQVLISGTSPNGRFASGVFVSSESFSNSGNITITTPQLRLDNRGRIDAQSASSDGGNITLNIQDLLLMRQGSSISATAGTAEAGGNGGNITINAPRGFIVGVKGENSDITANAFTGSGGRVNITAQGIYGLEFRPKLTEFSDITASSTFGVSGVVAINTLGIDPSRGLQQLPVSLVDPSNRIDQKCAAGSGFRRSSFTVTGRGGLPESPLDPLQSGEGVASWVEVKTEGNGQRAEGDRETGEVKGEKREGKAPIVEVTGWVVDKDGSVFLVANGSIVGNQGSWQGLPTCLLAP